MSVLIFLLILIVLVLVHELGHFLVAKYFGVRVDEFGLGFPPRAWGKKIGETIYSINWIPFGGFVRIFGENPEELVTTPEDAKRHFSNQNRGVQSAILVAGVTFNVLFAWLLISIGFMSGLPSSVGVETRGKVENAKVVVTEVRPDSPAEKAGLSVGDTLRFVESGKQKIEILEVSAVQDFVADHGNQEVKFTYTRGEEEKTLSVTPVSGIVENKFAIGIAMDMIGTLRLSVFEAIAEGAKLTVSLVKNIAVGLATFFYKTVTFQGSFSEVTGPVGLVGVVGGATQLGFIYLLSLAAFISLNLAVINLVPFPALDGGRLFMVIVEAISRKPIDPKITNIVNSVGFGALLLLMVVVTLHDVIKLF